MGLLLTGKEMTVKAADKVPLTANVFKDENVLKAISKYDSDENGYLDKNELSSINSLYIYESVSDISGLERLTSLNSVNLIYEGTYIKFGKKVTNLDLRINASSICVDAPGVKYMDLSTYRTSIYNQQTGKNEDLEKSCEKVDVSRCSSLKNLYLHAKGMTSFQLPKNGGNVKELRISESDITILKVPTAKRLTYLSVFDNEKLTSIDSQKASSLETLYILNDPKLKSLSLSKNKKLAKLICGNTSVDKLDISSNTNLRFLSCPNNNLTTLDCSKNTKLTAVQCYQNKLTMLNVKKTAELEEVSCENNKIKTLDLSQNNKLKTVSCFKNPLKNLYIKGKINVLKKVSIAPIIESAERSGSSYLTVTLKKNSKIKNFRVLAQPEGENWIYTGKQDGLKYSFDYLSEGIYSVTAASGVQYKDVTVYAKSADHKKKVLVESYYW